MAVKSHPAAANDGPRPLLRTVDGKPTRAAAADWSNKLSDLLDRPKRRPSTPSLIDGGNGRDDLKASELFIGGGYASMLGHPAITQYGQGSHAYGYGGGAVAGYLNLGPAAAYAPPVHGGFSARHRYYSPHKDFSPWGLFG